MSNEIVSWILVLNVLPDCNKVDVMSLLVKIVKIHFGLKYTPQKKTFPSVYGFFNFRAGVRQNIGKEVLASFHLEHRHPVRTASIRFAAYNFEKITSE